MIPTVTPDPDSWWLDELGHAGREHFDEEHARRYDAKMDAQASHAVASLQAEGLLGPESTVVDLGAGTGQFTLAAAPVSRRVVAVDVSPVMLEVLRENLSRHKATNAEAVRGGFLTYRHEGEPADVVYSRFARHHLPDFWKGIALGRILEMLRPGGVFGLSDVVYSFEAAEAERKIEAWIADTVSTDGESGWTRAELAEHIRDEHSTFTWLLEPMIERAGLEIVRRDYSDDGMLAKYLCKKL